MNESNLLEVMRTSSLAKWILEEDFDFLIFNQSEKSSLFHLPDGANCEVFARDAGGGEFALCDTGSLPSRPLLYASSEGQAGIIGKSLGSGLATIIDLPHWQDCLHFSGGGQLAEMRRIAPLAEADLLAENPGIESNRKAVRTALGLAPLSDPIGQLHAAITELSSSYPVFSEDDSQFGPLFGKLTAASSPWRRRLHPAG